ncbi:MAG: serine kinase [Synergistaceae bacterium]|nr:serine kinase [Synergistaceae bacterium]
MASVRISEICAEIGARVYSEGDMARAVERAAVGDLLSFVMGSDADGAAWITVQTHLNVAAVAVLKDIPVIIIASGREPAADLTERCQTEGIALVSAAHPVFDICVKLGRLGISG